MVRERKPMIEPGSMLPASDTLTRILERDRASSGRKPPDAPPPRDDEAVPQGGTEAPPHETHAALIEAPLDGKGNITSNITAHTRSTLRRSEEGNTAAQKGISADARQDEQEGARQETKMAAKKGVRQGAGASAQEAAKQQAQRMAASRAIPITLRMPEDLNDWLDEYAHAHRKQGVKKQDLIARAVQLLVVELSAGEAEGGDAD